jgi:hypothetical protein
MTHHDVIRKNPTTEHYFFCETGRDGIHGIGIPSCRGTVMFVCARRPKFPQNVTDKRSVVVGELVGGVGGGHARGGAGSPRCVWRKGTNVWHTDDVSM